MPRVADEAKARQPVWKGRSFRAPGRHLDLEAFREQCLEEVVRVTGVGERREKGHVALTLLSVESSTGTVSSRSSTSFSDGRPGPRGRSACRGSPSRRATTAGPSTRSGRTGAPGGGSDRDTVNWRMASAFAPAAPDAARMLTLGVDEVLWSMASGTELVESERTAGPWEFVVPLTHG